MKLQRYTKVMPCTLVGTSGPMCPPGWESVGYTQPGSCTIGNVPGDGPMDVWKMYGYNRVCKKSVPSSNDLAVDCCSNLYDIQDSVECKARGYTPYSTMCNNEMVKHCNPSIQNDPYGPEWNGMPFGQAPVVYDQCSGSVRRPAVPAKPGCVDKYCINYLKNAPRNNFFHDHDYQDYPVHFPNHSYTTPMFTDTWGYQPTRTSYKPYNDYKTKLANTFCLEHPEQCLHYSNKFTNTF